MGRVTIKSIAKDLGISHMTVSRALSGNPKVQQATREAVLKRARELGYVKSAAAKAMRGDGTKLVGLLLPNIVNEFYARFANTLAQACEASSYHLIIHLTDDDIEVERQSLQRLREVEAMAAIMVPAPGGTEDLSAQLGGMKVIQLIRQRPLNCPSTALLVDDHDAIRDAVIHLARQGHVSIGYIGADSRLSSGRKRVDAFRDGLRSAALEESAELILTDSPSFEMGRKNAEQLFDQGRATALVCGGFEISNGALSVLMARNIDPNRQLAFVGYGNPSFYAWVGGGISTIEVPVAQLADHATRLLDGNGPETGASDTVKESFAASFVARGNQRRQFP